MTEDQQQGLKQIRERTERLKIGREPVDEGEVDRVYENTISDLLKDIDFLLSIVKGQEANHTRPTGWVSAGQRADPRRVYVDFENRECAEAFIKGVEPANGPMEAAVSMRSLCVEKVKELRGKYKGGYGVWGDSVSACNEIIEELESLQLQEQEAKQSRRRE